MDSGVSFKEGGPGFGVQPNPLGPTFE